MRKKNTTREVDRSFIISCAILLLQGGTTVFDRLSQCEDKAAQRLKQKEEQEKKEIAQAQKVRKTSDHFRVSASKERQGATATECEMEKCSESESTERNSRYIG